MQFCADCVGHPRSTMLIKGLIFFWCRALDECKGVPFFPLCVDGRICCIRTDMSIALAFAVAAKV